MFKTKAKVTVKNSAGVDIATQEYQKVVFEGTGVDAKGKPTYDTADPDAVTNLLEQTVKFFQDQVGEKGNGVIEILKNVTYAYDLGERAKIRQGLVTAAAGPDKAIDKGIKDFMAARAAAGKPVTEEVARARFMALMAEE